MGSTWRLPPKATEPGASLPSPVGEHMLGWRCGALETTAPGTPWGQLSWLLGSLVLTVGTSVRRGSQRRYWEVTRKKSETYFPLSFKKCFLKLNHSPNE